jgi:hypothetical protein
MNAECALEGCDNTFVVANKNSYPFVYSTHDNKKVFFCSERCQDGFYEWAVWQKDLGNGIESMPPEYGNSIKDKFR